MELNVRENQRRIRFSILKGKEQMPLGFFDFFFSEDLSIQKAFLSL